MNKRKVRIQRREFIRFLDALGLYIQVGYDIAYSWPSALEFLGETISPEMHALLKTKSCESISGLLKRLSQEYVEPNHRIWFKLLEDLYTNGAPLLEALLSISVNLRKEEARDIDRHVRTLPTRNQVALILFFLPATFLLIFTPLLWEFSRALN